jgi:hypothetical protein
MERNEEAEDLAERIQNFSREAEAVFCIAAKAALTNKISGNSAEILETLKNKRLLHAVFENISIDEYISAASRLSEQAAPEKGGFRAYLLEESRSDFITSLVFDAVDEIQSEVCRLWRSEMTVAHGTLGTSEEGKNYREGCLTHIRNIFAATCHALARFREYLSAVRDISASNDLELRMYAVVEARNNASFIIECADTDHSGHDAGNTLYPDTPAMDLPVYYTAVYLDGGIEPYPAEKDALAAMSEELDMLAACSCRPAAEFLFAEAADIARGNVRPDTQTAISVAASLEAEAGKWNYRADSNIRLVIEQAAEYILGIYK